MTDELGSFNKEGQKSSENRGDNGFVLCLDAGGVLRSQTARKLLNYYGLDAIAAAMGNVSSQYFQGYIPDTVQKAMNERFILVSKEPIQQVTEEMVKRAKFILIFSPELIPTCPFIDPDDPRVEIRSVSDVSDFKNPDKYSETIKEILWITSRFAQEKFPDEFKDYRGRIKNQSRTFANRI